MYKSRLISISYMIINRKMLFEHTPPYMLYSKNITLINMDYNAKK